jgi:hypothetical protein
METINAQRTARGAWQISLPNGKLMVLSNEVNVFYDREGRLIQQRFKNGSFIPYNRMDRLHGFAKVTDIEYSLYLNGTLRGLRYIKEG